MKRFPPDCPETHPARLMKDGEPLFVGKAGNLRQRLDALAAIRGAKLPSQQFPQLQDVDAQAPHYCPGISHVRAARR